MPGVPLQTNPTTNGVFSQSHSTNGSIRFSNDISVAEIKSKAKDSVNKEARGASALSLIKTARSQILSAKEHELRGDLRSALAFYIKAATLAKMTMESTEYSQESKSKSAGGVLRKELNDFLEGDGKNLHMRVSAVEEKLKAIEKPQATDTHEGRESAGGKSIADRLRSLQDNGLPLGQTKLREPANLPTPPHSPRRPSNGSQYRPMPAPPSITPSTSASSSSTHTFVSPSTLGPPSPSSTPSSSPPNNSTLNTFDISGFSKAFPSIDELDENPAFSLPSVPTGIVSSKSYGKDTSSGDAPSPLTSFRNFTVPIERPSSTPITPTNNTFSSRPSSPSRPTFSSKPSGLSNGVTAGPSAQKVSIPIKNTAFPRDLQAYIRDHKVLLIDVRNRADFDREHIRADTVVCIEPSVLMRENVTADTLENAMVVGPRQEASLFSNRDKFEVIAVYDESSTSFGAEHTALNNLVRVISEQAFRKILKRMPMILVGGIEAWKRDLGDSELVRGSSHIEIQRPTPKRDVSFSSSLLSTSPYPNTNPFTNGTSLVHNTTGGPPDPHQIWNPRHRPEGLVLDASLGGDHRSTLSIDQSNHSRSPADVLYSGSHPPNGNQPLARRSAVSIRPRTSSISFTRSLNDTTSSPNIVPPPMISPVPSGSAITYPQFPQQISPNVSGSAIPLSAPPVQYDITSPPQASINPSNLSRRRSDYVDQSQEALSGFNARPPPIDYPELASPTIVRPPPVAAPTLERQDNRPRVQQAGTAFPPSSAGLTGPKPPRISSDYPVTFWSDTPISTSGLKNLGNTCYMNAPIQCLSATVPFSRFFTEGSWKHAVNLVNPLGSKGKLASTFARLLREMWAGDLPYLTPIEFRRSICQLKSQYLGSDQHDSQEFLSFLIDGIHEDLNRIISKPPHNPTAAEEAELERLPPQIASDREWRAWRARNDSLIVDFFQGQFRNRLECLTCRQTSTTYNVFSILQLPVPHARSGKVPIQRCLDAFFNEEVLERDDAWDCPKCKVKRRASKKLSLARLPPVLMIHLKRFEANGRFSDKIDTFVDFPIKSLDLTNYMPPPLPPGADKSQLNGGQPMSMDDPRNQLPPYRYDLYGVTNHYGNLSSGHYTASIASRGGWLYCDDSSVKAVDPKQVVSQKAYVLFYKRVRT